jgi:hypothetical protein
MRNFIFVLALLTAQPCIADEPKWYVLNRELGCQSMTEIHKAWPFMSGYWTPTALFNVLKSRFHDAKLVPLEIPKESKKFPESNALILSSVTGEIELVLMTADLCEGIGGMPVEPAQ